MSAEKENRIYFVGEKGEIALKVLAHLSVVQLAGLPGDQGVPRNHSFGTLIHAGHLIQGWFWYHSPDLAHLVGIRMKTKKMRPVVYRNKPFSASIQYEAYVLDLQRDLALRFWAADEDARMIRAVLIRIVGPVVAKAIFNATTLRYRQMSASFDQIGKACPKCQGVLPQLKLWQYEWNAFDYEGKTAYMGIHAPSRRVRVFVHDPADERGCEATVLNLSVNGKQVRIKGPWDVSATIANRWIDQLYPRYKVVIGCFTDPKGTHWRYFGFLVPK